MVFPAGVAPNLKDYGAEPTAAPTNGSELFRIVIFLVHQVDLVEYFLRIFEADPMFSCRFPTLSSIEIESHQDI
jgi:hypothetical protein